MDLVSRVFSYLYARRGVSLYTLGTRNKWRENAAAAILTCQCEPTAKMLRDLARELDVKVQELEDSLRR